MLAAFCACLLLWYNVAVAVLAALQRLMEHGIGFMERGNYPLALEAFEAAATLEPSFAEVRALVV